MYSTLSDTLPSAMSSDGPSTTRSARGAVFDPVARAPARAPFTLLDGVKLISTGISVARALAPVVTVLRLVGFGGPLAWLGLSRRRGPLATLTLFGAGVAAGAGAGVLFAPSSGAALRRALVDRLNRDATPERARGDAPAPPVEGDAPGAGTRIAPWISASTVSIQDSPRAQIDVNAPTAKDGAAAAKATPTAPPDHEHAAMVDSEAARPTRVGGAAGYRFG